jgi:hypothetical protein
MIKNKGVEFDQIYKKIQWLAESLFDEKAIAYFESCNQESIKNAINEFTERKILVKKSVFIMLSNNFRKNEGALQGLLDQINEYRNKPNLGESLISPASPH